MPTRTIIKKKFEECDICGCKSKVITESRGIGGGGTFLECPGEAKFPKEHDLLERKIEELGKAYKRTEEIAEIILILKEKFEKIPPKEK